MHYIFRITFWKKSNHWNRGISYFPLSLHWKEKSASTSNWINLISLLTGDGWFCFWFLFLQLFKKLSTKYEVFDAPERYKTVHESWTKLSYRCYYWTTLLVKDKFKDVTDKNYIVSHWKSPRLQGKHWIHDSIYSWGQRGTNSSQTTKICPFSQ